MKKFLSLYLLSFILLFLIIPQALGQSDVPCGGKNKFALPTTEGFGKDAIKEGQYEAWIKKTTCVKEPGPYANGLYNLDCSKENSMRYVKPGPGACVPIEDDPSQTSGEVVSCENVYFVCGASGAEVLKNYIRVIYLWGASLGSLIAVLIIVASGIQISAGNDVDAAKNRIMQSLGGLAILFLSALILYTINPTFFTT